MYNIIIKGTIVGGAKKGRTMGFPTANIILDSDYDHLQNGVYAAEITIEGEKFSAMANVGVHPTVGSSPHKLLEVNIFNFNREIYGKEVSVTLHNFIRGERKFKSLNDLIKQITEDKITIEKITYL